MLKKITQDIPNVGESALAKLDENGIVYVGAEVKPGDIIVGKVTPKGEQVLTPEEKLLRAIFGEKASDVKDSSLRVPPGVHGTIVDVQILTRDNEDKDDRTKQIEAGYLEEFKKDVKDEKAIKLALIKEAIVNLCIGQTIANKIDKVAANTLLDDAIMASIADKYLLSIRLKDEQAAEMLIKLQDKIRGLEADAQEKIEEYEKRLNTGDELSPGIIKVVKVFIAVKRKIQPGDKMAGRHGNKGVISTVVPVQDMPYMEDGTPVDIVLNPLGVPSRMNVGQILETHLGMAAKNIGLKVKNMYQEGQKLEKIKSYMKEIMQFDTNNVIDFDSYSDEELLTVINKWSSGVPMAVPVFGKTKSLKLKRCFLLQGLVSLVNSSYMMEERVTSLKEK